MNFTALKFEPHTILKAYAVLYGEVPSGTLLFLDRKNLKRQWEARARSLNRSSAPGWQQSNKREDTLDFEQIDWAYNSLLELLGGRDQAMVCGWACESIEAVNAVLKKSRTLMDVRTVRRPPAAAPAASTRSAASRSSSTAKSARTVRITALRPKGAASPVAPRTTAVEPLKLPRVSGDVPGPRVRLMFGRFLLSRGRITLQQLIDAVRWQRAQRPPVGRIAMNWGILSANQVYEILSDKSPEDRFCDVAVRKGFMTGYQRLAVLGRQREMQKPIGSYFVENGILTREEVEGLAAEALSQ